MKALIKIFAMFIMMNVASVVIPQRASAQVSVSFQVFYDDLSPYGYWVNNPGYGYIWIPDYGPDFVPYYSNGYWVFTDFGWTWVSYYQWGWAPFHYGRWAYDDLYGWFWVPDDIWGPAWVSWRMSPGYYGWVPLGPNISFALAIDGSYNPPANYWVFVNTNYMGSHDIYLHYSPRKNNSGYISQSTVINHTYVNDKSNASYIAGPKREEVEKAGGIKIKQMSIKESTKHATSVRNNELAIYKPDIAKNKEADVKPAKVLDLKEVKPVSERTSPKTASKNREVKKEQAVMKKSEVKGEVKQNPHKEMKHEQAPKKAESNINQKSPPKYEMRKQDAPPKVQPNMNENKKQSMPPSHKEMKQQGPPPRMNQPNNNNVPRNNSSHQPHHKPR